MAVSEMCVAALQIDIFLLTSMQIDRALSFAKRAVELNPYHAPCFSLLVLLSTCKKDMPSALKLANAAQKHHPDDVVYVIVIGSSLALAPCI